MRISRIDIRGFGKLVDLKVETGSDFNLIFGLNESGKSTLQAFIRAMFFGLGAEERDKFKPWYSDDFGGSIEYMLDDGEEYVIERDFDEHSIKVTDKLGNIVQEDGENAKGVAIDPVLYDLTAHIQQSKVRLQDEEKNIINRRINSMLGTELDNISVEETVEMISKYSVNEAENMQQLEELDEKIENIREEIRILEAEKDTDNEDPRGRFQEGSMLIKKLNTVRRNYEDLMKASREKDRLLEIKQKKERRGGKNTTKESLDELIRLKNKKIDTDSKRNSLLIPFFVLCTIAICLGVYSYVEARFDLYEIALIILAASFVDLMSAGLVLVLRKRKSKKIDKKIEGITKDNALAADIGINDLLRLRQMYNADAETGINIEAEIEKCDETINLRFASIKLNAERELGQIKDVPVYIGELERRIDRITGELADDDNKNLDDLKKELESIQKAREEKEKEMMAFRKTIQALKEKDSGDKDDSSQTLTKEFKRMISVITSGRYEEIELDGIDVRLSAQENIGTIGEDRLSTGTVEQFHLALRFALSNLIFRETESMPILMDEIFAYSDEKRIVQSVRFLDSEKNGRQMFYLTCRRTEASIVKTIMGDELNIIKLKADV